MNEIDGSTMSHPKRAKQIYSSYVYKTIAAHQLYIDFSGPFLCTTPYNLVPGGRRHTTPASSGRSRAPARAGEHCTVEPTTAAATRRQGP
eukprot:6025379-Amphidinium_carterae.1